MQARARRPPVAHSAWPLTPHASVPHANVTAINAARRRVVSRVSSVKTIATVAAAVSAAVSIDASIQAFQSLPLAPASVKAATTGNASTLDAVGVEVITCPSARTLTM